MTEDPTTVLARLRKQLSALDNAMSSGVLTVESADTGRVTYRTYGEMRQARGDLMLRVRALEARVDGTAARSPRQVVVVGRSGW